MVGLAASAYAPAKYGLVTETVPQHQLVRANGWLEVTVVLAVILGTASGGVLLSLKGATVMVFLNEFIVSGLALSLKTQLAGPLFTVMGIYVVAALLNWGIPSSNADYAQRSLMPMDLLRDFRQSNRILWQDRIGCLSLSVTTLFWGVGAVIQFAVLLWAQQTLNMPLEQGAYLQAVVAFGVIAGAAAAGYWIRLEFAEKVLPLGILLGFLLPAIAFSNSLSVAIPLMLCIGFAGGVLMVPMNALLQHRGYELLTAGRSIAVQGFNENASVLVMLGVYSLMLAIQMPLSIVMSVLGIAMSLGMACLTWIHLKRVKA